MKHGFKTWAEKKSLELRADLGLKEHDHLCAFALSLYLKIPVYTPSDLISFGLMEASVATLLGTGSPHWSAAMLPISFTEQWIIHNPNHSAQRQQSNIMHEIGHVLCNHSYEALNKKETSEYQLRAFIGEQEEEAEWLGSCLQLPRKALSWALYKSYSLQQISELHNASIEMVKYRVGITGLSKQMRFGKN